MNRKIQTLLALFANWFIPHRDPGIIRRNALVASGNSASRAMIPGISVYAAHPDWILRAHAVWALARIGGEAATAVLERRRIDETDVRVRAELS